MKPLLSILFLAICYFFSTGAEAQGSTTPPDYDLAITHIIAPQSSSGIPVLGWAEVVVNVANLGTQPVYGFFMQYEFIPNGASSGTLASDNYWDTLYPGDTVLYTFDEKFLCPLNDFTTLIYHSLSVSVGSAYDTFLSNNTMNSNILNREPFEVALSYGLVNGAAINDNLFVANQQKWYQFTADSNYVDVIISLCGSQFDCRLSLYRNMYDAQGLDLDNSYCGVQYQLLIDELKTGTYYLKIEGQSGAFGQFTLSITGTSGNKQDIDLPQGWSMFSTFIEPANSNYAQVMSSIENHVNISKDWLGQVYWPLYNMNQIGNITNGSGYEIKMQQADTLHIKGQAIYPEISPIVLQTGWNMIAYLRTDDLAIETALQDIETNVLIVKNYLGQVYWPLYGVNLINEMKVGEGYKVNMNLADTLKYPSSEGSVETLFSCGDVVYDIEGHFYNTVQIGTQCWMKENMKSSKYSDGSSISKIMDHSDWTEVFVHERGYSHWAFDSTYAPDFGLLYNWAAATNGAVNTSYPNHIQGICPGGWHVPKDNEWLLLEGFVDSLYGFLDPQWLTNTIPWRGHDAGKQLKSTTGWDAQGNGPDTFGFSSIGSGQRTVGGDFSYINQEAAFWTATEVQANYAVFRGIHYQQDKILRGNYHKNFGNSVRCVKD
jgi:uncharacterized protein (TIGR02145 family)